MSEIEVLEEEVIKESLLGKSKLLRLFLFQTLGTMILAMGICCTKYTHPFSNKIHNPLHDEFISLSLYFAIVICSPFTDSHFNPAVSLSFLVRTQKTKSITFKKFFIFLGSSFLGAFIGVNLSDLFFDCGSNSNDTVYSGFDVTKDIIGEAFGGFIFIFFIIMLTHQKTSFITQKSWIKLFIPIALFCGRKDSQNIGGLNPAVMISIQFVSFLKDDEHKGIPLLDVFLLSLGSLIGGVMASIFFQKMYLKHMQKWRQQSGEA